ncbi:MAG: MBL fold metallo-hydrolase [Candidatus Doudnabacteria bacterium]|nr:MBL fold metallo-hydrolase [Candidatus Doudnabacteria bacterium]
MTISWFGLSSFKIVSKDTTIITDPFGATSGLAPVRGVADIIICSDPQNNLSNNFSSISGSPFLIAGPGEYELKGVFIMGQRASNGSNSTIYSLEIDEIRVAFFGQVKQAVLDDKQKEILEGADIVLIGVGNDGVLNSEQAAKIATQLEPFLIIPHSFNIPGVKPHLDKVEKFIREMGGETRKEEKITIKKKDLVGDVTQVLILTPQR